MVVDERLIAYSAGLYNGEGNARCWRSSKRTARPSIRIVMCDRSALEKAQPLFSRKIVLVKASRQKCKPPNIHESMLEQMGRPAIRIVKLWIERGLLSKEKLDQWNEVIKNCPFE